MTSKPLLPLLLALAVSGAYAAPTSPQVAAGQATFAQQGNVFSITNTPNTVINWQSFSVNAGEITRFVQQSADSAVLNRIVGQDPSRILGALQSNGHVFLINPNGIVFGKDARVDVNGLTASTLGMSDADFLAGRRKFDAGAGAGSIVNQGSIATPSGGKVFLIAPDIDNSGIVTAPDGSVVLAAGRSVTLADSGNPDLHVVVSAPQDQAINLGQIVAAGGRIGIYGALVRQRGVVNANSAQVGANGQIVLKASADTTVEAGSVTSATGAGSGGAIAVLGQRVGITGNALLDASGGLGGGSVLVGGDYQGANAQVPNARVTYFGQQASIRADALGNGNGGKVVLWSQDATRAYGSISARGGALGGNGGLVETSGHYLDVNGIVVKAGAPKGLAGTWLLDPYDIDVVSSGGTAILTDVDQFADGAASGTTNVDADALSSVDKATNIVLQAQNDVTFLYPVQRFASTTGSLTVEAGNNVTISSALDTNGGALILRANAAPYAADGVGGVYVFSGVKTGGGTVSASGEEVVIGLNGAFDAGGGSVNLSTTSLVRIEAGGTLAGSGAITVASPSISLLGTIGPSATQLPAVTFLPAVSSDGITVSTVASGSALNLLPADLARIHAGSLSLGDQTTMGDVSVLSQLSLAPAQINTLKIETQGSIAINAQLNMGAGSSLTLRRYLANGGNIAVGSGGSLAADSITLASDNIQLDGGVSTTTNGNTGMVKIAPHSNTATVTLGTGATDSANGLGLDGIELSRITTGQLGIGGTAAVTVAGLHLPSTPLARPMLWLGSADAYIDFNGPLTTAGNVTLAAPTIKGAGASGTVTAPSVTFEAKGSIGSTATPFHTATSLIKATNDNGGGGTPVVIENTGTLNLAGIYQTGTGNQGDISVSNTGGMTLLGGDTVLAQGSGQVKLVTHSPLTINGTVTSGAGTITLEAGNAGVLTIAQTGSVASTSGAISVTGGSVVNNGNVTSSTGNIAVSGTVSGTGAFSTGGTLSGVPTNVSICQSNPNAPNCNSDLPSLSTCVDAPSTAGCDSVLPSLSQCVSAPSSKGCSVVLPSLDSCIANPSAAGCSVVLPSLSQCTTAPATTGCSAVLPTLSACVADPAAAGCTAVLPSLDSCVSTPTAPGCTVVLPSLASCVAAPMTAGCTVVLPTLTSCIANPAATCCSVVLPTLSSCIAAPATSGCSVVLPTLNACIAAPATSGCSVVLPSLIACTANPAASGCTVVLPTLSQCTSIPTLPGCSVVLPSLSQCTAAPSLAGCSAVLPTLQACVVTPGAAGCSVVLPSLNSCIASPATAGCSAVLPSLAACVADPAAFGCTVVLPTLSACIGAPATAGCSVVLPTLAQCVATPTLQGCTVVLPPVSACVANPTAAGCVVVVPPTSAEPQSPVDKAVNNVVVAINQASTRAVEPKSAATGGGSTEPVKKEAPAAIAGDSKTEGAKSEKLVKKTYCN